MRELGELGVLGPTIHGFYLFIFLLLFYKNIKI